MHGQKKMFMAVAAVFFASSAVNSAVALDMSYDGTWVGKAALVRSTGNANCVDYVEEITMVVTHGRAELGSMSRGAVQIYTGVIKDNGSVALAAPNGTSYDGGFVAGVFAAERRSGGLGACVRRVELRRIGA